MGGLEGPEKVNLAFGAFVRRCLNAIVTTLTIGAVALTVAPTRQERTVAYDLQTLNNLEIYCLANRLHGTMVYTIDGALRLTL